MSAGARTLQVRLMLSAVDRGLDLSTKLVVPRRDDETMAHVVLRVLAFCLFYREGDLQATLRLAPGPADRDGPDLWAHDLAGRPAEWIICGAPDVDDLRHVLQHQRQAKVRVVLGSPHEREALVEHVRAFRRAFRRPIPGLATVDVREVNEALVQALADRDAERQRWTVTVVDGHLYVDADGMSVDGEFEPVALPGEEAPGS